MHSVSTSTRRLTGERPQQGVTPDSLLALHDAGYRSVIERLGAGRVLDLGCGEGFESVKFVAPGRHVVGVDYSADAAVSARGRFAARGLRVACMDASLLALGTACFDWACSSHIIEHFTEPELHVAEIARVLRPRGTVFVLTPNAPADFENPFHVHLFEREELSDLLEAHFSDVWVGALEAVPRVKEDLAARRARARRLLALDVFDLRHRIPRSLYIGIYTRLLPLAYRVLARGDSGGATGISGEDFFVADDVDPSTPVLFAIARGPRAHAHSGTRRAGAVTGSRGGGPDALFASRSSAAGRSALRA